MRCWQRGVVRRWACTPVTSRTVLSPLARRLIPSSLDRPEPGSFRLSSAMLCRNTHLVCSNANARPSVKLSLMRDLVVFQ